MKLLLTLLIVGTVICGGCGPHVRPRKHHAPRRGYPMPIPGCAGGFAFVPDGCFVSEFEDHIQVNCPDSTTKFSRCS